MRRRSQGVDEIAHHRVVQPVADEQHGELAEQLDHEPCRPTVMQVGVAEVGAGQDQIGAGGLWPRLVDPPVQMDDVDELLE